MRRTQVALPACRKALWFKQRTKRAKSVMYPRRTRGRILQTSRAETGRGLFGQLKRDTTTVFQDCVGIVVGAVFLVVATELVLLQVRTREHEMIAFGYAKSHWGG